MYLQPTQRMRSHSTTDLSVLASYTTQVKKAYRITRTPTVSECPPPPTDKYISLAMIKEEKVRLGSIKEEFVQMTIRGRVDDILHHKVPVKLEQIFSLDSAERKVILIEGAPGSGKSTLLWHICQRWEAGASFLQFKLVVIVQLRDPLVQTATSLSDILPFADKALCEQVASDIQASHGEGVLILLDGWDEAPEHLRRESLFCEIIRNPCRCSLDQSTVLVSSRPVSSVDLHHHATTRIEVVGFSSPQVEEYITESLQAKPEAAQSLLTQIKENPILEETCYLPLNLAILTHVFMCMGHTLPPTYCGIIMMLVLSCLLRHIQKNTPHGESFSNLPSLDDLPTDIRENFALLCRLAYNGLKQDRYTFSSGDLRGFKLPSTPVGSTIELPTLGLMQAVQSFVASGKSTTYHFLHLSIQELCAAKHIADLQESKDQIRALDEAIGEPRLHPILEFYSTITRLTNEEIRDFFAFLIKRENGNSKVGQYEYHWDAKNITLCRCVHEAQDSSLCPLFEEQVKYILLLLLNISDTASIGYFLSHSSNVKCLSFLACNITAKLLAKALMCNTTLRGLKIHAGILRDSGASCIGNTLHATNIEWLQLIQCDIKDTDAKALAESLEGNKTLKLLELSSSITENGVSQLAKIINSTNITHLILHSCNIRDVGVKSIAAALENNTTLTCLDLTSNCITDYGVLSQALASNSRSRLTELGLDLHTEQEATMFIASLQHTSITKLYLKGLDPFDTCTVNMRDAINTVNVFRTSRKTDPLEVQSNVFLLAKMYTLTLVD